MHSNNSISLYNVSSSGIDIPRQCSLILSVTLLRKVSESYVWEMECDKGRNFCVLVMEETSLRGRAVGRGREH